MPDRFSVFSLFRLDGEAALVTAGGNGIGRVAAVSLAELGAKVAVTDIDGHAAEHVAAEIRAAGGDAMALTLDVSDERAIVAAVEKVHGAFGRIDVLVNNAGITKRIPTEELALEDWRRVLDVNITAAFLTSREVGRHMLAAGGGRIINMASIMGVVGNRLYGAIAYHSSKGALVNFTRGLAAEWGSRGVRVNAIAPTFVRTRMTERLREDAEMVKTIESLTPMRRFAEAEELAGGIVYLATRASSMVTGHILAIDGGWLAV